MRRRLTLVGEGELPAHLIADTEAVLTHVGWLGLSTSVRQRDGLSIYDGVAYVPPVSFTHEGHDHDQMLRDLLAGWRTLGVAAAIVGEPFEVGGPTEGTSVPPALVVMDVDSTLIQAEVIERVANRAGVEDEVREITLRAMRGEMDFKESLRQRVAMVEGVPATIFDDVIAEIEFSVGARELVDAVHAHGGKVGVVSGGFHEVVDVLAEKIGLDYVAACRFEVEGGILTGRTTGEVVDAEAKVHYLRAWAAENPGPVVAIGDGANDLPMIGEADLGIAYCGKPIVAERADAAIPFPRLDAARALMGV